MQGRVINRRVLRAVLMRDRAQGVGGGGNAGAGGQQTGGQAGGQQQNDAGAGGADGGGGGDPFEGLFDDLDTGGDGSGAGNGGQGSGAGQGGGQQNQFDPQQFMQQVESAMDRRINKLVNTLQGRYQNGRRNQQQSQQNGQQQNQGAGDDNAQSHTVVDQGAVREARMAFREYLTDMFKPLSPVEREFAVNIGSAVIGSRDLTDSDPDDIGREVARQTSQAMLAARKSVRDATIAQLKKQGAFTQEFLEKTKQGGGQSAAGAGSAGATAFLAPQAGAEGWAKGAAAAAKFNQQQGWTKPAAANTGS
jgi:hypothetical protein